MGYFCPQPPSLSSTRILASKTARKIFDDSEVSYTHFNCIPARFSKTYNINAYNLSHFRWTLVISGVMSLKWQMKFGGSRARQVGLINQSGPLIRTIARKANLPELHDTCRLKWLFCGLRLNLLGNIFFVGSLSRADLS